MLQRKYAPENRDVAVLSITGIDVVLPVVPSFAHHVVGTHSRQGNTGRPSREAAKLESKLDGSWIANPEAFSCCCMLPPHSPALGPGGTRVLANPARNPGRPTKAPTLPPGLKGGS